ncbi:response regulator [Nitrososphaera sp.]|uniref:response regulator n=1 Tax=Nitrososphaera sp. TaxID=1971748 RepID=UPI00307DB79B
MNAPPFSILVVDDEPDILTTMKLAFGKVAGKEDYRLTTDTNPLHVLENFKPNLYDMAILDVRMPEMDGFALYERLRAIDADMKVCFMTAFDVPAYQDIFPSRFPSLSEKCYIKKPIAIRNLIQVIREELSR